MPHHDECDGRKRSVDVSISGVLAIANAQIPRGASPQPVYAWERYCPAPEGYYEEGVQIGPAAVVDREEPAIDNSFYSAFDHVYNGTMGTSVSWGSVPFRWEGVRYDTQSSLCVHSDIYDAPWSHELYCDRGKCEAPIELPLGTISASNYVVMPPYVTDADIKIALEINHEYSEILSWPISILETPNDPRKNPGRRCPGPADSEGRCDDLLSIDNDYGAEERYVRLTNGVRYAAKLYFEESDHVVPERDALWTREQSVNVAGLVLKLEPIC